MLLTPLSMITLVRPVQPLKAESPTLVTSVGMVMPVRPVQPEKAEFPMLLTPLPMVMPVSLAQPEKALFPILVTLLGMVTAPGMPVGTAMKVVCALSYTMPLTELYVVLAVSTFMLSRLVQPEKANPPMLVTPVGMVTPVRPVQPEKASCPMLVTLAGMVTTPVAPGYATKVVLFLLYSMPPSELYAVLAVSTFIVARLAQPLKALTPMLVTLAGMDIPVRLLQLAKAPLSMLVTPAGMVIPVRLLQL
jgi:hypothetical protein